MITSFRNRIFTSSKNHFYYLMGRSKATAIKSSALRAAVKINRPPPPTSGPNPYSPRNSRGFVSGQSAMDLDAESGRSYATDGEERRASRKRSQKRWRLRKKAKATAKKVAATSSAALSSAATSSAATTSVRTGDSRGRYVRFSVFESIFLCVFVVAAVVPPLYGRMRETARPGGLP